MDIQLYKETTTDVPLNLDQVISVVKLVQENESCSFSMLEVVYVEEKEIIRINSEHLGRNYVTDVITFRYDENQNSKDIEGTVFCCAPRITEQSAEFNQEPPIEYARILIHGLLHLTGYEDHSEAKKKKMTEREDYYLQLISDF